jgi:hypothetical protein
MTPRPSSVEASRCCGVFNFLCFFFFFPDKDNDGGVVASLV